MLTEDKNGLSKRPRNVCKASLDAALGRMSSARDGLTTVSEGSIGLQNLVFRKGCAKIARYRNHAGMKTIELLSEWSAVEQ